MKSRLTETKPAAAPCGPILRTWARRRLPGAPGERLGFEIGDIRVGLYVRFKLTETPAFERAIALRFRRGNIDIENQRFLRQHSMLAVEFRHDRPPPLTIFVARPNFVLGVEVFQHAPLPIDAVRGLLIGAARHRVSGGDGGATRKPSARNVRLAA